MGFFSKLFGSKNHDDEMKKEAMQMEHTAQINNVMTGNINGEFNFTVEDVFTITGRGTVVTGSVNSGTIKLNDEVLINGVTPTVVTGIEMFRKTLDVAQAGDKCGILLRGIDRNQINSGDTLTKK